MKRSFLFLIMVLVFAWVGAFYFSPLKVKAYEFLEKYPAFAKFIAVQDWPPQVGKPYPDIEMVDQMGQTVRLSEFKGKVIVVEPVGMSSPASQAWIGAHEGGPWGAVTPQAGLQSWSKYFPQYAGIPFNDPRFVFVQCLYFNLSQEPTTPEDAKQWAKHFNLDRSQNRIVLAGSAKYLAEKWKAGTYQQVPGLHVIDSEFILRADATGRPSTDDLYLVALPMIGRLVATSSKSVEVVSVLPWTQVSRDYMAHQQALKETAWAAEKLFKQKDFAFIENWMKEHSGRKKQGDDILLAALYHHLSRYDLDGDPQKSEDVLNLWCQHSSKVYVPFLVRGSFWIRWAWDIRGGDLAYTVPQEVWPKFEGKLKQALVDLQKAYTLNPSDATSSVFAIHASMGLGRSYSETEEHFRRAIRSEPGSYAAYSAMFNSLSPKWSSREKESIAFVRKLELEAARYPSLQPLLVWGEYPYWLGREMENALNFEKAVEYYKKAGDQGLFSGYSRAAWLLSENPKAPHRYADALALYQKATEKYGTANSLYKQGMFYENGWGVSRDVEKALGFYKQAAEKGYMTAMEKVAWILMSSKEVSRDYPQAMKWYEKAAADGSADAKLKIGWMHFNGWGVPQDTKVAFDWYQKAAAGGSSQAMTNLGWAYHKGLGVAVDKKQAKMWYLKAVEKKNEQAVVNLRNLNAGL